MPELLVVIVIILFASSVSIVAYSNFRKGATVRTSAEKVSAAMVNARTRAIASNLPSSVLFDLENNTFWIDDLDATLAVRTPKVIAPETLHADVEIESVRINSQEFTSGMRRVVFQPDGTNPFVTINIRRIFDDQNDDAGYFSIQIYPTAAEPKIWPNERK